jgi:rod shape-determining protein MreD
VRRVTFALAAILAAVVVQMALLDRLPFPGGSAPDLVLVLVVTLALASGPLEGMLIGFGAGLALDMAPPASNLLGLSALVLCVIGYGCGWLRGPLERSAWLPLGVVMLGVTAGETLYALAGMIFGDPDITWQSARLVLPVSVVYDILLCPFVVAAVVRFGGYGGWAAAAARRPRPLAGRGLAGAGLLGGLGAASAAAAGAAIRDTRSGREPRLRAAAARQADGWVGGHQSGPGRQAGPWVNRRPLHLRARSGVAGSAAAARAGPGRPAGPPGPARAVHLRLGAPRRGDGVLGGSLRTLLGGGRESRMRGSAFRGSAGPAGEGSRGGLPHPRSSPRLPARAFRGTGGSARALGDGSPRGRLRAGSPLPGPRLRSRAFRGGPALTAAGRGRPGRPAPLRLRGRRGDGVVGGGVLGSRASGERGVGGGLGGGRGMRGAAFTAGRAAGAPGALRSGRGQGAVPRFRGAGRGLLRWGDRVLPGRRGGMPGRAFPGGALSGGSRGGLGGRRRGFGGSRRTGPRWRRSAPWRTGTRRTGGLP